MPTKTLPLKLKATTFDRLESRARDTGVPPSNLAQCYVEEGLRMDAHPRIVFRDGPVGRRPAVAGGPDVWEIINSFDAGSEFTEQETNAVAKSLALTTVQVQAAVDYYREYRDEIDEWIRRNDELAERHEREGLHEQGLIAG